MLRILCLLLLLAPALAEARTFTSSDGKTIQAEIVAATETTVTLLRESDQRTFELPIARISKRDSAHVAAWRKHLEHPLGWRRLRIHGDGQSIVASCLPIYGPLDGREAWRTESNATLELTLPVGAWVQVGIHISGARIEGLVQYRGASNWYFSSRDNALAIRTSPKAKAIPAVLQARFDPRDNALVRTPVAVLRAGASLTATEPKGNAVTLPRTMYQAAKLHVGSLDWTELPPSLRALQLHVAGPVDLAGIERFPDLEHLSIAAFSITGLEHLTSHRNLRSLYLKADSFSPAEFGYLGGLEHLRHLFLNTRAPNSSGSEFYSFLGNLTNLESLALTTGPSSVAPLDTTLIKNCTRLTRIDFSPRGSEKESFLKNLPGLTDISLAQVSPELALELMRSGHFKHLHTIREARFKDPLVNLPKLRNLQLGSNSWPKKYPEWEQLPFLERMVLRCPSNEALERISSHPAFQSLHHLVLLPTGGAEVGSISHLSNLRSLKLDSHTASGSFDVSAFPKLHTLHLTHCRYLDIPSVQNLRALRLELPKIDRVGDGSATKLKCLEIVGSSLVDLDGVKNSPELKSLHLQECARLESHSGLTKSASLGHVHVSQCPRLPGQATN